MWPGPALPSGQTGRGLTVLGKCAYFDKAKPLNSCLCVYSIGIFFPVLFCEEPVCLEQHYFSSQLLSAIQTAWMACFSCVSPPKGL